jgi:hypothetical protein
MDTTAIAFSPEMEIFTPKGGELQENDLFRLEKTDQPLRLKGDANNGAYESHFSQTHTVG